MGATYLKSFEVEIQIAFSFGLFRIIFYVSQFCFPRLAQFGLGWFEFFIAVVDPISNSEA